MLISADVSGNAPQAKGRGRARLPLATMIAPKREAPPRLAAMRKPKAPDANRARIVKAAINEFASRGFKGASMDAIAARTHTTRAMINYYFGNKEKVYLTVLEHVYAEIRDAEDRSQEHGILIARRLLQKYFLAGHGNDTSLDTFGSQRLGGVNAWPHFGTSGNQKEIRSRFFHNDVGTFAGHLNR